MGGRFFTRFSRSRVLGSLMVVLMLLGLFTEQAQAEAVPAHPQRRDWWFKAPGGTYGLVEVSQFNHAAQPSERKSHTSILLGPWRWTFQATAPQVITSIVVPSLVALFTYGWIRTRRR